MKKIVSLCLAMVLLIGMLPLGASAASTTEDLTADQVFQIASELFPEYASTILGEEEAAMPSAEGVKARKCFEQTRFYSDALAITYTQYTDGTAYVTATDITKKYNTSTWMEDSEIISSDLVRYTIGIKVYSKYDSTKKLQVTGIKAIVDSLSYDNFTSKGTISSDSVSHSGYSDDQKEWEDSSGAAYVSYYTCLPNSSGVYLDCTVKLNLSNGAFYITITNE